MTTDRELLDLAAKAYWGDEIDDVCSIRWSDADNCILYMHSDNQDHNGLDVELRWNPLEENYDTFELQVKLEFTVNIGGGCVFVSRYENEPVIIEPFNPNIDRVVKVRLAITRAAAEIGRNMP